MVTSLQQAIIGIMGFVSTVVNFTFSTPFPGFNDISIGSILLALFIISLGFSFIEYFLNASGVSEKTAKKRGK